MHLLIFQYHYTKLDEEDSQSSEEEGAPKKAKVYVPPKVAAVPYGESGNLVMCNFNESCDFSSPI